MISPLAGDFSERVARRKMRAMSEPSLPPGPRSKLGATAGYARNPLQYFLAAAKKYGDPFLMRTMFGTWFVTGHPEAIRTVYGADPSIYDSFIGDALAAIAGEHSLVVIQGERHRKERKLLMPHFHGQRMRAHGERIREIALRHAAAWPAGAPFVLHDSLALISMDVIIELVFGVHAPERIAQFRDALLARDAATSPMIVFFKGLRRRFGGLGPWARFQRAARRLDDLFLAELAARRGGDGERDDILQQLLGARYEDGAPMPDRAILDELITVAIAGHETTAITLAWAFYWIARDPAVRARLLDELAALGPEPAPEAIASLPYLEAVCHETLRLTHPGTDIMRQLNRPLKVLDYELPAGVGINTCIPLLHRREDLYPEPDRFRPERFLERTFSPFEFVPFGGGHRRCLGAAFAMYEMKLVLATLLPRFPLRLARDQALAPVRWNVFMAPKGGVRVIRD